MSIDNLSSAGKIYTIHEGEYSDTHIHDKAFLTREDAEYYVSVYNSQNKYRELHSITEVEIVTDIKTDDSFCRNAIQVYVHYSFNINNECILEYIKIDRNPMLTGDMKFKHITLNNNCYNFIFYVKHQFAQTEETFDNNYIKIERDITKIVSEKITKLRSLIEIEGWTMDMVKSLFEDGDNNG